MGLRDDDYWNTGRLPEEPIVSDMLRDQRLDKVSGNDDSYWTTGKLQPNSDQGTMGTVLRILDYPDRPRNLLAAGLWNLQDQNPRTGFYEGVKKGLMGEQHVSWGDFLGIGAPKSTDDWDEWLAKGGSRLLLDAILDPLNLAFGAGGLLKGLKYGGKGVQALSRFSKVGDLRKALASGAFGKAFYRHLPNMLAEYGDKIIDFRKINEMMNEMKMSNATGKVNRMAKEAREQLKDVMPEGVTMQEVFQAIERPGSRPDLEKVVNVIEPLRIRNRKTFDEWSRLLDDLTGEQKLPIEDIAKRGSLEPYRYAPRIAKAETVFRDRGKILKGAKGMEISPRDAYSQEAREIFKWYPSDGSEAIVSKFNDKFDFANGQYWMKKGNEMIPVERGQASLNDLAVFKGSKKGLTKADDYIDDPIEAYRIATARNQAKLNYLRIVKQGTKEGWLTKLKKSENAAEGFRRLKVPNMGHFSAPKPVATHLENSYKLLYDPEGHADGLYRMFKAYGDSTIGRLGNGMTTWWKRNVLPMFLGFHLANAVSNLSLVYMAGVRNPARIHQALQVLLEHGDNVIKGITNTELKRILVDAGVLDQRVMQYAGHMPKIDDPSKIPFLKMWTSKLGRAGDPIQRFGEGWGKLNDMFFGVGGSIENHARMMVVVDKLKKLQKVTGKVPDEKDIYKAGRHALDHLFDYVGDLTPLEKQLTQIFPFASWTSNITKRTIRDYATQPQRLGRLGRFWDTITEPLDEQEKSLAPDWMQDQGPVHSLFGIGGPESVFNLSRFIPYGTIEQFLPWREFGENKFDLWKPLAEVFSLMAPQYKAPLELGLNKNVYKNEPIDYAGNPLGGLLSSLVGGTEWSPAENPLFNLKIPAGWEYLWRQSPIGRHSSLLDAMFRGITHEAPGRDPMSPGEKAGYFATSGRVFPWNTQRSKARRVRGLNRQGQEIRRQLSRAIRNRDMSGIQFWMDRQRQFQKYRQRAFHNPS